MERASTLFAGWVGGSRDGARGLQGSRGLGTHCAILGQGKMCQGGYVSGRLKLEMELMHTALRERSPDPVFRTAKVRKGALSKLPSWALLSWFVSLNLILALPLMAGVRRSALMSEPKEWLTGRLWGEDGMDTEMKIEVPQSRRVKTGSSHFEQQWDEKTPLNATEVNIAYFLQISQTNAPLLPRLIRRIHHPENIYVVHFDKKMDSSVVEELQADIRSDSGMSNVHFMEQETVTYKGISAVLNTISALSLLLKLSDSWEYFIFISGSDYPLVSAESQRKLLAQCPKRPIYMSVDPFHAIFPERMGMVHNDPAIVFSENNTLLVGDQWEHLVNSDRVNPLALSRTDVRRVKSEAWMQMPRDFVRYLVYGSSPRKILLLLSTWRSPIENYFRMIAEDHPEFRKRLTKTDLRLVVWRLGLRRSGQHPYSLDGDKNDIYYFWDYLEKSKDFFARKMSIPNSELLDRIDEDLMGIAGEDVEKSEVHYELVRSALRSECKKVESTFGE